MKIQKIAVRGGHNYQAAGAVGIMNEVTEDRQVYPAVIRSLRKVGFDVLDVTPGNMDVSSDLVYGVRRANEWGADLFISIHFNKAYNHYDGKIGTESYVHDAGSTQVALRINDKLVSVGFVGDNGRPRGVKVNSGYYELNSTDMVAIIVEVCFLEATGDVALYRKLGPDAIGELIAEGIANMEIDAAKPLLPTVDTNYDELYRVRRTWTDVEGQKGAYGNLENAKKAADGNPGYKVFNKKGTQVYPATNSNTNADDAAPYRVRTSWSNSGSQKGAFSILNNAISSAKEHGSSYKVYDRTGKTVYPSTSTPSNPSIITSGPNPTIVWSGKKDDTIKELQKILKDKGRSISVNGISDTALYNILKDSYTIELFDRGPLTKWVQDRLNAQGYNCGFADGYAEQATMDGIQRMQSKYKLGLGFLGGTDWYYLLK